jgi:Flp pilus assembly protein TadG
MLGSTYIKSASARSIALVRRLHTDVKGLAALEFAFIAPILVMGLLGTLEISQAVTLDRRVTNVAAATADLVGQVDEITTSELDDIMQIVKSLVNPYDTTPLKVSLTSVGANTSGSVTVDWGYGFQGGTARSAGSSYTLPPNLISPNTHIIIAEVEYAYTPLIPYFLSGTLMLTDKIHISPRMGNVNKTN